MAKKPQKNIAPDGISERRLRPPVDPPATDNQLLKLFFWGFDEGPMPQRYAP